MHEHLSRLINARGPIGFAEFIHEALYAPKIGFYRRPRPRVGLDSRLDFYTAASFQPLFAELICSAAVQIWGAAFCEQATFVEVGAEPEKSAMDGIAHPFAALRVIRLDDPLVIPSPSIVFCNELLDAQPFHRLVFHQGRWRERGVTLQANGALGECLLPTWTPELRVGAPELPESAPEGYQIDLPLRATQLLQSIVAQPWNGALLCFDYGKSWHELSQECPQGTARGYHRHRMVTDLIEHPGAIDITCHVCWDFLTETLEASGFDEIVLERQEQFLVRHGLEPWWRQREASGAGSAEERRRIQELIHPDRLGHKFQVLRAGRKKLACPGQCRSL